MTEPDVTLTDYLLTLECLVISILILRRRPLSVFGRWLLVFFGAIGFAALAGGTFHGFFNQPVTPWHEALWILTMLGIGVAGLAAWHMGIRLMALPQAEKGISLLSLVLLCLYAALVVSGTHAFIVAILYYLPPVLFLLAGLVLYAWRHRHGRAGIAAAGMVLTLIASWVQAEGIGVHPQYFTPSALQHVIQAMALLLIYRGTSPFITGTQGL